MLLGAVVSLYFEHVKAHRVATLMAFVVLGLVAMTCTAVYEHISDSDAKATLTGGKTFCYFDIIGQQQELMWGSIRKSSEYPLSDVSMSIQALVPAEGGGHLGRGRANYAVGNLPAANKPAFGDYSLSVFDLKGQSSIDFHVKFHAKNGYWIQILCLRKIGDQWKKATKVFRIDYGNELYKQAKPKPKKPVFEYADNEVLDTDMEWRHHALLYH